MPVGARPRTMVLTRRWRGSDDPREGNAMASAERKNLGAPEETRTFEKGRLELVNIGGGQVGRLVLDPGRRRSEHVKPIAGTAWCEAPHFQYHVAGRLHVLMADGTEFEAEPGEVTDLPAGHD